MMEMYKYSKYKYGKIREHAISCISSGTRHMILKMADTFMCKARRCYGHGISLCVQLKMKTVYSIIKRDNMSRHIIVRTIEDEVKSLYSEGAYLLLLGRDTVNTVPLSSSLLTLILPLCASTIAFVIARPNPDPPVSRFRDLSAL